MRIVVDLQAHVALLFAFQTDESTAFYSRVFVRPASLEQPLRVKGILLGSVLDDINQLDLDACSRLARSCDKFGIVSNFRYSLTGSQ